MTDDYVHPKIPADLVLSEPQKALVERHLADVEAMCRPSQRKVVERQLAGLLLTAPTRSESEALAELRLETYWIALDDIPAWAVAAAVRMWLRRENSAGGENYAFAPAPPQLRRLAEIALIPVRAQGSMLLRLLRCEPENGFTAAHRADMAARAAALAHARGAR